MIRLFITTLFLSLLLSSCKEETKPIISTIKVEITNKRDLDSLIIYNKENSWEVMSCLRFSDSNNIADTLNITETKLYPIYSFKNGVQGELGELILSPKSQISLSLDEQKIFESVNYDGTFELSNNFLAYSKSQENQLTEMVRNGIENSTLESNIKNKKELITKKGTSLKVTDSLSIYVADKFNQFANILKKKNKKYLYKNALIDSLGNNFIFKDIKDNSIDLSIYKGKYVYIDVWATWCKPCKEEAVFLKDLEKHFSYTDKLEIISISIDREHDKWKNYIADNSVKGTQLYSSATSDFVKFYDIGALPRFIFLAPDGKIISPDEIRPSNPETLKKLEKTINSTITK